MNRLKYLVILFSLVSVSSFAASDYGKATGQGIDKNRGHACESAKAEAEDNVPSDATITRKGSCDCSEIRDKTYYCSVKTKYKRN